MTASEKDSIVVVGNVLYENSAKQLDYLYSYNKSKKEKSWYIFFLGGEVEDLQYILNNSVKSHQYDVSKLAKLNEKLTKINKKNPDYEVYAAITDFNKTLKVTSLFDGEKLSKHIEQIEDQLSIDPTSKSQEQLQLRETKQALVNFSTIKVSILDSIYNRTTAFKQSSKKNHFLPYIMNLTYEKMANYEEDAHRKQFFVWGVHPEKKEKAINKNYLNELYQRYKASPDKSNIYRFAEVQLESVIKSLELYVSLPDVENLKEGIGQEVYQLFANEMQGRSDEEKKLLELSNYLTDNYNGEHFVVDSSGCLNYNCEIKEDLITVLNDLNIKTIAEFEDVFKFKGVARHYEGRKNVFTTYYSKYNLWVDLDNENYNKNSFDYHIQDGGDWSYEKSDDYVEITDRYYYSLRDLLMRYDIFNNPQYSGIKSQIIVRESVGQASSISYEDFYDQYTSKYNTNASYPFIAEWSSRWAEAPLIAYSGYKLVLDFGPFLIEELSRQIGKAGLEKIIRGKGKDALQGAIIDFGIQVTFNYLFDDELNTIVKASSPQNINWISVGVSAVESAITYKNKYLEFLSSTSLGCMLNATSDSGGFKGSFELEACGYGIAGSILGKAVGSGVTSVQRYLKPLSKYTKDQLRRGLMKLNIKGSDADAIIENIKKTRNEFDEANSPNIANKIDELGKINNPIDDLSLSSRNTDEVLEELIKTNKVSSNNSVLEGFKKFWSQHEQNVTRYLQKVAGNINVGRQITMDIYIKGKGKITCRVDNLVQLKSGKFKVVDAKSSKFQDLSAKEASDIVQNLTTKNQKAFYEALKDGAIEKIKPRGSRAIEYFEDQLKINVPENLNIAQEVEFFVNDMETEGYSIYKIVY